MALPVLTTKCAVDYPGVWHLEAADLDLELAHC